MGLGESLAVRGSKEGRKEGWAGKTYIKMSLMICTSGETELLDEMKENVMDWSCGTYGGVEKWREGFSCFGLTGRHSGRFKER